MTMQQENVQLAEGASLLTSEDLAVCKRAASGIAPYNQRARALMLLNEGKTPVAAAELSGLSLGQVRYWLNRFKKLGSGMLAVTPKTVTPKKVVKASPAKSEKTVEAKAATARKKINVAAIKTKDSKQLKKDKPKVTKKEEKTMADKKKAKKIDKKLKKDEKKIKAVVKKAKKVEKKVKKDKKKAKKIDKKVKKTKAKAKKDKKKSKKK